MTSSVRPSLSSIDAAARRGLDVIVAVTGLTAAAPIMVLLGVVIRLETPGPIFFRQLRLGCGGRPFCLFKFRKFAHDLNSKGTAVTLKNDPRMTRVGRLLERSKLDELPQLWNILRGDMSIVGPRPETLDFADCFRGGYQDVLDHKPGLFGPNQAIFRDESSLYPVNRDPHDFYQAVLFPAKARVDLLYFSQRNLLLDVGWIIRCVLAVLGVPVLRGKGMSGIETAENWIRQSRHIPLEAAVEEHN